MLDSVTHLNAILAGGTCALIAIVILAAQPRWSHLMVAVMLWAASMGWARDGIGRIIRTIWFPVQDMRSFIFLGGGLLLFVAFLANTVRGWHHRMSTPALMLLVMAFYAGLMRVGHGEPVQGLFTVGFALATILPLALIMSTQWDEEMHELTILRMPMWINIVWIGMVLAQFVVNRGALMSDNGRFHGVLGNPQHAAVLLASFEVLAIWLLVNDPEKRFKLLWIGLAAADVILLGWTSSRTGMILTVLGCCIVLRNRIGRAALFVPIVAAFVYVIFDLVSGSISMDLQRFGSTDNTRREVWAFLLQVGMDNPMFGAGPEDVTQSENSFLLAFAAYGIGMLVLSALLVLVCVYHGVRVWRAQRHLGSWAPIADVVLAFYPMYLAGAIVEGYMMARVSASLVFLIMFAALGDLCIRIADENIANGYDESAASENEDDDDDMFDLDDDGPDSNGGWDDDGHDDPGDSGGFAPRRHTNPADSATSPPRELEESGQFASIS